MDTSSNATYQFSVGIRLFADVSSHPTRIRSVVSNYKTDVNTLSSVYKSDHIIEVWTGNEANEDRRKMLIWSI